MKRCLVIGDQCHWLPVREQEEKTGLQVKENKDARSWEGSPRLLRFQGANIGGNSEEHRLVQDHLTVSVRVVSSAQETPFSQSHLRSPQGWREPGPLLVQARRAHGCGYMTYGLTRVLHWWRCFSYSLMVTTRLQT